MSERKPYVIRLSRSVHECLTCKARMYSVRKALKHECGSEPTQAGKIRPARGGAK